MPVFNWIILPDSVLERIIINFGRILLLSTALVISINTIAGGRSSERNLMDDFLQDKTSANPDASAIPFLKT
jgi:hypothetical protein